MISKVGGEGHFTPLSPRLFLDRVVIRNLGIGNRRFDIMLRRYGDDVSVNVLDRVGGSRLIITV